MSNLLRCAAVAGILLCFAGAGSAGADCVKIPKAPQMPQGATASEEDMKEGHDALQKYVNILQTYEACISQQIKDAPPDTKPEIAVEQIDVEPGSGRFTAGLAIVVPGEPLQRLHLAGRVQALVTAVVATHRLLAGAPIQPSDVRLQRVPSGTGQDESAQNLSQVIGQALRHPLNAGQKIAVAELSAPILVQKGALVQIQLQVPGLAVTAAGTAADSGAMGDHIGVLNPASGAIIEAEITGPDQVRVLPGNALRRPARSGQTQISLR